MITEATYVYMKNGTVVQTDAQGVRGAVLEGFEKLGGAEFFHRLTKTFYGLVAKDDLIGPMFSGDWDRHARHLAAHFIRLYGRPDLAEIWNPNFLRAHLDHVIGQRHRLRWLALMAQAGQEISAPQPVFDDFMLIMLMSASVEITGFSHGAAMARGSEVSAADDLTGSGGA